MAEKEKDDVEQKDDETIEVSADLFKQLIDKVDNLEKNQQGEGLMDAEEWEKGTTERKVDLLYVDDQPVVGFVNQGSDAKPVHVYNKRDPNNPNEVIEYVTAILYTGDEKKPHRKLEVEYEDLLRNADKRTYKVINENVQKWHKDYGTTEKTEVKGYAMQGKDVIVPVRVKGDIRTYVIDTPEGELEVHEDYVNLS